MFINNRVYLSIAIIILSLFFSFKDVVASSDITNSWQTIDSNYTIASHVSFVDSNRIYIIAGATTSASQNIVYAEILNDGSVDNWVYSQNVFPEKLFYHSIANYNNYYYILGGVVSPDHSSSEKIYISHPDREIRDVWIESEVSLPKKLSSGGTITINDYLYYIGGTTKIQGDNTFNNTVYYNKLNNDGSLNNNWHTTISLRDDQPWTGFATVQTGSRIILIGGKHSNNVASNKVFEGIIDNETGEVVTWQETFSLPTNEYTKFNAVQAVKVGNYILASGGTVWDSEHNRTNSNLVFFSEIYPDGSIGPWQQSINLLPFKTCCGALIIKNTHLYYIGGYSVDLSGYHNKIFYTEISNPSPPPSDNILDVNYQSQLDPEWKNDEYDTASVWYPSSPTIEKWGCALTSVSMVLNYFNHDTNPKLLNNWLISQPDGYIRNGLLNWLAISRYTKIHKNTNNKMLEFKRQIADDLVLRNEIEHLRPSIINVPGHFFVVKGIHESDFVVNDPASIDRSLLSQVESYFEGDYVYINSYLPSETDFSYILLVINNGFTINVYDTNNTLIEGKTYFETPISDPLYRNPLNYNPLNIFMYPKPTFGEYILEVIGNGNYEFDIYIYNNEGNVTIEKSSKYNSQDKSTKYSLFVNENGNHALPHDAVEIFNLLEKEIHDGYKNNLINNRWVYISLNRLIHRSYKLYERDKSFISNILIRYSIKHLMFSTPKFIDNNFSILLQSKLEFLLRFI